MFTDRAFDFSSVVENSSPFAYALPLVDRAFRKSCWVSIFNVLFFFFHRKFIVKRVSCINRIHSFSLFFFLPKMLCSQFILFMQKSFGFFDYSLEYFSKEIFVLVKCSGLLDLLNVVNYIFLVFFDEKSIKYFFYRHVRFMGILFNDELMLLDDFFDSFLSFYEFAFRSDLGLICSEGHSFLSNEDIFKSTETYYGSDLRLPAHDYYNYLDLSDVEQVHCMGVVSDLSILVEDCSSCLVCFPLLLYFLDANFESKV